MDRFGSPLLPLAPDDAHALVEARLSGFAFLPAADLRRRVRDWYDARARAAEEAHAEADKLHRHLVDALRTGVVDLGDVRRCQEACLRAAERGQRELKILQFPNELCTDGGRAVNNAEPDWAGTLTGVPRQIHDLWHDHLRPLGYRLSARIEAFPGGMPGDVGFYLDWD